MGKICIKKSSLIFTIMVLFVISLLIFFNFLNKQDTTYKTKAAARKTSNKIYDGTDTSPSEWPFIVAIRNNQFVCTGSLIDQNWVITAAHCVSSEKNSVKVFYDVKSFSDLLKIFNAPKYVKVDEIYRNSDADIALLKLKSSINHKTISLIGANDSLDENINEESEINTTALGYGFNESDQESGRKKLQKIDLKIKSYADILYNTESREILQGGDSGGPLLYWNNNRFKLLGVSVASGVSTTSVGPNDYGAIFINVKNYTDWIKTISSIDIGSGNFIGIRPNNLYNTSTYKIKGKIYLDVANPDMFEKTTNPLRACLKTSFL